MKKFVALLITLVLTLTLFTACMPVDNTQLKIGYMQGPTGMGMAKLIHDNGGSENGNEKYAFKKYTDTSAAMTDLLAGNADLVCVPTNDAARYYNATDENFVVLAINCLSTLYVITDGSVKINSFAELENKTIYTCKNGTPKIILEHLLSAAGVNATVKTEIDGRIIATPNDLATAAIGGLVDIAVAPEPIVTNILLKNSAYEVDVNLSDVWNENSDTSLAMGCIIARKDVVKEHKTVINSFLNEYKSSIEFINAKESVEEAAQYIVDAGIMQAQPAAKKSLNNLRGSIAYLDGKEMKNTLLSLYNAIGLDLIGGKLPDDEFYYAK